MVKMLFQETRGTGTAILRTQSVDLYEIQNTLRSNQMRRTSRSYLGALGEAVGGLFEAGGRRLRALYAQKIGPYGLFLRLDVKAVVQKEREHERRTAVRAS